MTNRTDIEIAQESQMQPISEIAMGLGIDERYLEQYGKYKAKIDYNLLNEYSARPDGKLILVTAISPTPAGEGKTTTTVGLADGLRKIGKQAVVALREPSLGPVFGIKGGAAGGGYAQVVPMEDINLHFTGDFHAIGAANNLLAAMVDYHIYHKLAWPLLALSLVLLTAVLFMPEYNGCKRWLVLPGLGTLQPSEIAKFAVVLVFAHIIALNHDRMGSFAVGVVPFALVLGVVAVLMLLEPHLSGTVLILSIGAVLMFVGGTGLRWFMLAGAGGAAAIGTAIVLMPELVPYAADRLNSWLDPFADPLGDGHQTIQSLYAIGSGGAAGLGLGNSRQKHLFVPEPQNDFIFSILCEELGFLGACAVILLFSALLWRGITLAAHAPDRFGALLVVGFVVQVALQAVLNIAVVTNTIPNTGISLPFFSSGGTSLMMLLGEMGIVLSVSRGES